MGFVYLGVCVIGPFTCRVADYDEPRDEVKRFKIVGESYVHELMHGEATGIEGFTLKEIEIL